MKLRSGTAKASRNSHIDGLRGLSIFVVIFLHFCYIFSPAAFAFLPGWAVALIATNGYYGVTVFFVISGFLITSHAIQHYGSLATIRPHEFYLARFARIAPLSAASVLVLTAMHLAGIAAFVAPENSSIWTALWTALTFQFNWYYVAGAGIGMVAWSPLWSLSVEEVFYVLFPVVGLALRKPAYIAVALAILIVQAPFARIGWVALYLWSGCADAIAMGCLAALLADYLGKTTWPFWAGAVLRWTGLGLIIWRHFAYLLTADFILGPSIIAFGAALFLVGAAKSPQRRFRLSVPLEFIGRRSYEIYLIHMFILLLMKAWFGTDLPDICLVIFLFVAAGLGELIGRQFTDPMNKWIRSIGRTPKPAVAQLKAVPSAV
ncbi:acyltransferase [Achromobacter sp.]|uniref:acyltransferase family protein n=1 Tax=Achromobacter sp. TaxID=134375 RepID=UPI002F9340F5